MKVFNWIMIGIRCLAVAIIIFCLYAFAFNKEEKLLKPVAHYFIIFVMIYFFGSLLQMLIRLKSQGKYYSSREKFVSKDVEESGNTYKE